MKEQNVKVHLGPQIPGTAKFRVVVQYGHEDASYNDIDIVTKVSDLGTRCVGVSLSLEDMLRRAGKTLETVGANKDLAQALQTVRFQTQLSTGHLTMHWAMEANDPDGNPTLMQVHQEGPLDSFKSLENLEENLNSCLRQMAEILDDTEDSDV